MSCIVCCPKAKGNTPLERIVAFVKNLKEDIDIKIYDDELPNYIKIINEFSIEYDDENYNYSDVSENTEWVTIFNLNRPE